MQEKITNGIHYVEYGNKEGKPILFLHGWGQNIEMMKPVGDGLQKDYRILIVDLPGFGKSEEPKTVWTLYDYVEELHKLMMALGVSHPIF